MAPLEMHSLFVSVQAYFYLQSFLRIRCHQAAIDIGRIVHLPWESEVQACCLSFEIKHAFL